MCSHNRNALQSTCPLQLPLTLLTVNQYLFFKKINNFYFKKVAFELSNLLNTGLDRETLNLCAQLLEEGANPEALAVLVTELNKEASR